MHVSLFVLQKNNDVLFFIAFDSLGSTPRWLLDRGEMSSDLTDFSSTNGALRAVKGTQEGDESHVDLTWHCGKTLVTQLFIAFGSPGSTHAAGSR